MLSFFRINDPYRLVPVFIILLLIRIPFMIDLTDVTIYEVKWMALGSKLSGGASMFIDVWDNTAPLSAGIFWLLDEVFGRSHFVYYFFGLLLVTYQCALLNSYVIRNNAMQENTYLLAFVYGILMSLSEEFMLLSPLLIGLTFFILSLNNIFGQIQIRAKRDEKIMIIGIYMGIATMCHFVYLVFFIGVILTLMIFSGTVLRRYLLMVTGYLIPILLVALYYLMIDGLTSMLQFGTAFSWSLGSEWYLNRSTFWILSGFPLLLLLLSFLKLTGRSRLSNYQSRLLQSMILFLFIGSFCFFGFAEKSLLPLILVVPSIAYLTTQYFLLLRRGILNELWFLISIVVISLSSYVFHYGWFGLGQVMDNETLIVGEKREEFRDKSVLILGNDWSILREAEHVTPFFNWRIASELFENLDYYDNQSIVLEEIIKASPDFIIDKSDLYPLLDRRFPAIRTNYKRGNSGGVYQLQN